jgi:hypothetical protein
MGGTPVAEGRARWLPMPYTGQHGQVSLSEWREYRHRQAMHAHADPAYETAWRRPSTGTANAVWELLAPALKLTISQILPKAPSRKHWITDADSVELTAKQAFLVVVDSALRAGETGEMFTTNHVLEALAACWSDHFREVRAAGRAQVSWDMKKTTLSASLRDLLRNGVRLDALSSIVRRGCPGLYATERIQTRGYTVQVDPGAPLYDRFCDLVANDGVYRRHTGHPRLLLAYEDAPASPPAREVAGEWAYNQVVPGKRSLELIRRLEAARLWVHVPTLVEEVTELEETAAQLRHQLQREYRFDVTISPVAPRGRRTTKSGKLRRSAREWAMRHVRQRDLPAVNRLVEEYDTVSAHFKQLKAVRDRLQSIEAAGRAVDGHVEIKSAFRKLINRRYQSVNFWPTEVTTKDVREEIIAEPEEDGPVVDGRRRIGSRNPVWALSSRRGRWFSAAATGLQHHERYDGLAFEDDFGGVRRPLVGVDVSASQLQVLAVLCGLTDLEAELRQRSFWKALAARAWARHADPTDPFSLPPDGFSGPDSTALLEAVKKTVMTRIYGSEVPEIARKLRTSWTEYGPGLGGPKNVQRLLDDAGAVTELVSTFLPMCQAVADAACQLDPCAGVTFTDPYDGARARWNPIRRQDHAIARQGTKVYVSLPVGTRNASGDYPVDRKALRRKIAPFIAHMIDAAYAGMVVEKLNDLGVRDLVSVHDCWMVASDARPALLEAVQASCEPWLQALGSVYDDLERYLGPHQIYGPHIRAWRQQWQDRVGRGDWPQFRVSEATLYSLGVGPICEDQPERGLMARPTA